MIQTRHFFRLLNKSFSFVLILSSLFFLASCSSVKQEDNSSIETTMDDMVTRLIQELSDEELNTIDQNYILNTITDKEKQSFSSNYWRFSVNVPVLVSLMRDTNQKVIPFWLEESDFVKTELTVNNSMTTYEVWQKEFPEGEIGLGINGFDKHNFVYFISVAPLNSKDNLEITPIFPAKQTLITLDIGAYTYSDWDQLVLTEVPERLKGQTLFTTFRGRSREAHIVNAFRETKFPSSSTPDQILLTWDADPTSSVVVQWRTQASVKSGSLKYWIEGGKDTVVQAAERNQLADRLLINDRYVSRFNVKLSGLKSATTYGYVVENEGTESTVASFKTADVDDQFSFIWFGDTHNDKGWGDLIQKADKRFPDVEFYSIAGDLVNTGLYRDDWDELFTYSGDVFRNKPLMAVPGNHDSQNGLGASLYQSLLTYPANGPEKISPGLTYAMTYKNALFLMIDVVSVPVEEQSAWIDQQLADSDAHWKFVTFHFSPYNAIEDYPDIVEEWVPLFDKHKVDIVMTGHYHYYLRTEPMFNSKPVAKIKDGTIYIMSIGASGKNEDGPLEPYAVKQIKESHFFQHVTIDGNKLSYQSIDEFGKVRDSLIINK